LGANVLPPSWLAKFRGSSFKKKRDRANSAIIQNSGLKINGLEAGGEADDELAKSIAPTPRNRREQYELHKHELKKKK